ncbi:MAG TPA: AAA family ATPase [Gemmataceae bacterium]|nr:AAA family ATPase [Gemmataceae bacterium]
MASCIRFDEIQAKPLHWLWPGRLPRGKLTLLEGDPDLGKSTILLDIAARITSAHNGTLPDGEPVASVGNIIVMSAEDDPEDTVRPRLELLGADLRRVYFLDEVTDGKTEACIEIPRDLDVIAKAIKDVHTALVVIDPLMAFLTGIDSHNEQSSRQVLKQISKVASETGCAFLAQRHWNKGGGQKAIYRGGGSIAFTAHARCSHLVAVDPDDDKARLLAVVKNNRGPKAPTLRYCLEPVEVKIAGEQDTLCRVVWCGTSPYTADQLVSQPATEQEKEEAEEKKTKSALALELLRNLLQEKGKVAVKEAETTVMGAGVSRATVERASNKLQVVLSHETVDGVRIYYWTLPNTEA